MKLGDAKALLEQVKTFCSKNNVEYELFENAPGAPHLMYGGGGVVAASSAPERIVGDKKELTEEDLKPPPPPPAPVPAFGFGYAGFGAVPAGIFGAPMPAPSFSFGAGVYHVSHLAPKPPEKKKEYGVDYI